MQPARRKAKNLFYGSINILIDYKYKAEEKRDFKQNIFDLFSINDCQGLSAYSNEKTVRAQRKNFQPSALN